MRKVEVEISWALSLINCAEDYGFTEIVPDLLDLIGGFTLKELDEFATEAFLSGEAQAQGYSDEDYESCIERLSKLAKQEDAK